FTTSKDIHTKKSAVCWTSSRALRKASCFTRAGSSGTGLVFTAKNMRWGKNMDPEEPDDFEKNYMETVRSLAQEMAPPAGLEERIVSSVMAEVPASSRW